MQIETSIGTVIVRECIRMDWPVVSEKTWTLFLDDEVVASLTFTPGLESFTISDLEVREQYRRKGIGLKLLHLLQSHAGQLFIEVPANTQNHPFVSRSSSTTKPNMLYQHHVVQLNDFDRNMTKAAEVKDHMDRMEWGHEGRMDFYRRYPAYCDREAIRLSMVERLNSLSPTLFRFDPVSTRAKSVVGV